MNADHYNQCVHEYSDKLYRFAVSLLAHEMDAEDVVQGVFERLWKRHDKVDFKAAKTYLFTSVHRACIDQFRKRKTEREVKDKLMVAEPYMPDRRMEDRQYIEELLKRLNENQKSLVLLRDYEGYSYEEISEITGLTLAQVKINLFRARKKLQIFLSDCVIQN